MVERAFTQKAKVFAAAFLTLTAAIVIRICDTKNQNAVYPVSAGNGVCEMGAGVTLRDAANSIYQRAVSKIDA